MKLVGEEERAFSAQVIVVDIQELVADNRVAPAVVAQVRKRIEDIQVGDQLLYLLNGATEACLTDRHTVPGYRTRRPDPLLEAERPVEALRENEAELGHLQDEPHFLLMSDQVLDREPVSYTHL